MIAIQHRPKTVVFEFVVTGHCHQTSESDTERIEYLRGRISPNLQKIELARN